MSATAVRERLRERRVFNPHGFYGDTVYIDYTSADFRGMLSAHWQVHKRGEDLSGGTWYEHGGKGFHGEGDTAALRKADGLAQAQAWAGARYKVEAWAKDPFGSYGPATFVATRLAALLALEPQTKAAE